MKFEEETKKNLRKWGKICTYSIIASFAMLYDSHATLEIESTKVTTMLLGTMFHGIVAACYGYKALPLLNNYELSKFGILTLMVCLLEIMVIKIQTNGLTGFFG